MSRTDCKRTIYLFRRDHSGEFVWKRNSAKGNKTCRHTDSPCRPTACRPNRENQLLDTGVLQRPNYVREILGTDLLAATVTKEQSSTSSMNSLREIVQQLPFGREDPQ